MGEVLSRNVCVELNAGLLHLLGCFSLCNWSTVKSSYTTALSEFRPSAAARRGLPARASWTASLEMDDLIASTGVNYRAVTNPSFMDNLLRQVEAIKNQGAFFWPISGDLKQPSACTRDIAATAAKLLLLERSRH